MHDRDYSNFRDGLRLGHLPSFLWMLPMHLSIMRMVLRQRREILTTARANIPRVAHSPSTYVCCTPSSFSGIRGTRRPTDAGGTVNRSGFRDKDSVPVFVIRTAVGSISGRAQSRCSTVSQRRNRNR
jgi:hypothetical protein